VVRTKTKTAVGLIKKKRRSTIKGNDVIFDICNYALVTFIFLITLYPLVFVVSSSLSSPQAVELGLVKLFPVGFDLSAYKLAFQYNDLFIGYRNSLFYTVAGTIINVVLTIMAAYPLSRKDFYGRNVLMFVFTFTMFFSGGLIPSYLLVKNLGMINTVWAMLIPGALSVYNVIITRTFFQTSIPDGLQEAASIDGCGNTRFLLSIVLPLSGSIIAVNALFYSIGHWNSYFNALLYLSQRNLFPLQIFLREILIQNQVDYANISSGGDIMELLKKQQVVNLMKYALIVMASVPLLIVYPFVQKYFVKGLMIGSIKG
jgi:putative aldouronate transport system permease protein